MRAILITGLWILAIVPTVAHADHANADSVVVGDLVLHGATDKYEYSLTEPVHASFWIVNQSVEPETLQAVLICDPLIKFFERSCLVVNDTLTICEGGDGIAAPCRSLPQTVILPPGLTMLGEGIHLPDSPLADVNGALYRGNASLHGWDLEPIVPLHISYIRRKPTAVEERSWGLIKSLYR